MTDKQSFNTSCIVPALDSRAESMWPLDAMLWQMSEKYFSIIIKEIGLLASLWLWNWVRGVLGLLEVIECSLAKVSILSFKDLVDLLGDKEDFCLFSFISNTVFSSLLLADCSIIY